jgi:hypothetical protein
MLERLSMVLSVNLQNVLSLDSREFNYELKPSKKV